MSTSEWAAEPDLAALQSAYRFLRDDPVRAMSEFNTLVNSGSLMSLVYIGYMFEEGLGVEASLSKAEEYYTRAFASGSIPAAFSLGRTSWKRGDYRSSEKFFSWGTERNDPRAMYWLAAYYLRDRDNRDGLKRAVELLERASSLGHLQSTRRLGQVLMRGHFGIARFFHGLRIYVSTPFIAARLIASDPASQRLLDLPLK